MKIIAGIIALAIVIYFVILLRDLVKKRAAIADEKGSWIGYILFESLAYFLVSFGVSDSAMNTLYFRLHDKVSFKKLPGTILVGATLPSLFSAFGYATSIKTDPILVVVIVVSAICGEKLGSSVVAKSKASTIRWLVAGALILSAIILAVKIFLIGEGSGTLSSLPPSKMVIVALCEVVIASLSMVGLGATPPMAAVLMLLGFDPVLALGTVIIATSILCFAGAIDFMKYDLYAKKPVVTMVAFGSPCALLATRFVNYVDTGILQILVLLILLAGAAMVIFDKEG